MPSYINLCGCYEPDELAAFSDEDIEVAGEVEQFAMEARKIKTQASHIKTLSSAVSDVTSTTKSKVRATHAPPDTYIGDILRSGVMLILSMIMMICKPR
jgi:hypothetical protein